MPKSTCATIADKAMAKQPPHGRDCPFRRGWRGFYARDHQLPADDLIAGSAL
jgi:hypothetical protein